MMKNTLYLFVTLLLLSFTSASRCGKEFGKCPEGQCCSKHGYCGKLDVYCGGGCQSEFGKCNNVNIPENVNDVKDTKDEKTAENIIDVVDAIISEDLSDNENKEKVVEEVINELANDIDVDSAIENDSDNEEIEEGDDSDEVIEDKENNEESEEEMEEVQGEDESQSEEEIENESQSEEDDDNNESEDESQSENENESQANEISEIESIKDENKQQKKEIFSFLINGKTHKASIVGLHDKNLVDIDIPQYFVVDDEKYYVDEIYDSAFSGSKIRSINISSDIKKISISAYAFRDCKELETFNIDTLKVEVNPNAFQNANVDISFTGKGVPAFVNDFSKKLVKSWGFSVNKDYTSLTQTQRKYDLFNLAKKLNEYVTFYGNYDQGNAAVALAIRHASWGGISRAYYNLALAMGIKDTEILIGGDAHCSAWNYVKVDDKWYNVDASRYNFENNSSYSDTFFYTDRDFSSFLNTEVSSDTIHDQPSNWVVVLDRYHYKNEMSSANPTTNYDNYLKTHGLGQRA